MKSICDTNIIHWRFFFGTFVCFFRKTFNRLCSLLTNVLTSGLNIPLRALYDVQVRMQYKTEPPIYANWYKIAITLTNGCVNNARTIGWFGPLKYTDELSPGNATLPFVYFPFFNGLLSPFTKYVRMAFRLGTHGLTIKCFSLFLSIFPEKVYWMHVKAMLLHTKWTKWNMCTRENKSRIHRRAHVL